MQPEPISTLCCLHGTRRAALCRPAATYPRHKRDRPLCGSNRKFQHPHRRFGHNLDMGERRQDISCRNNHRKRGATTYAYSTATYTISGSTGTWSDPDPALSVPSGATVKIEAIYTNGTLSGNIMTLTEKNIVMKATSTNITIQLLPPPFR